MTAYAQSFKNLLQEHQTESDRGCALIIASNLDNRLTDIINALFVDVGEKQRKDIFEGTGCLSSFSSKINICYALGLIPKNEFDDLNIIRKIRNEFAHSESGMKFSDQRIADKCNSLSMLNDLKREHPDISTQISSARSAFVTVSCSISLLITHRIATVTKQKKLPNTKIFR